MELLPIHPNYVAEYWPIVSPLVDKALKRTATNPAMSHDFVEGEVLSGRMILWVAFDAEAIWAAIVMAFEGDTCALVACGGSRLKDFLPLWRNLEQFARSKGCKHIYAFGRPGWRRVLDGYKTKMAIIAKKL